MAELCCLAICMYLALPRLLNFVATSATTAAAASISVKQKVITDTQGHAKPACGNDVNIITINETRSCTGAS